MTFNSNDVLSLALCAWKEARGEGTSGMLAVMCVIRNRAAWYAEDDDVIHHVIYAKNQFTSMSVPSDPEFNLAPREGDPSYEFCLQIAPGVLSGNQPDCTGGALYYANLNQVTSGWFIDNIANNPGEHPKTATIGKQTFFK